MNPDAIIIPVFTAAITAILVAGVNHFWNRRYLLAVEREKYRQALFSEKLKTYVEISISIHEFTRFASEVSARLAWNNTNNIRTKNVHEVMNEIYERLVGVNLLINKHTLLLHRGLLDQIASIFQHSHEIVEVQDPIEAINRIEVLSDSLWKIVDVFKDDLGIEEFGQKLE